MNQLARVTTLFHAARAHAVADRDAFLAAECGSDAALRAEVESLLVAHDANPPSVASTGVTVGSRIGDYEVTGFLAAGGMGEVYRARDTKLGRDVALKILPQQFVADPDRRGRFEREARALAALNHPNIATIYGFVESRSAESNQSINALALELIEGETLAERLTHVGRVPPRKDGGTQGGPAVRLPLDEALRIAKQIAEGLEAAHEQGIIHRDLKPANIKVTRDGIVKVLDFGLAKLTSPVETGHYVLSQREANVAASPTITSPGLATGTGVLLGTPAYMSPEQIRGEAVDKRSDLWSFGVVMFEMLTGHRLFDGATVPQVLAGVLANDPDWTALPTGTPVSIRTLLRRCLHKDRKRRLESASDARLEIEDAFTPPDADRAVPNVIPSTAPWRRTAVAITVGVATIVFAAGGIVGWMLKPATSLTVTRFTLALPEGQAFGGGGRTIVALSPDGTRLVHVSDNRLYSRSLAELNAVPIAGTESTDGVGSPVFSPDGQSLAYYAGGTVKKIAVSGGAAVTLCRADNPRGMSWGPSGIVFGQGAGGVLRVSANGGQPEQIAAVKPTELAHGPQVLPDGETLLFTIASTSVNAADRWDTAQIVAQSLRTGERTTVLTGGADARYVSTGHLVYALGGVLFAVPFDAERRTVTGAPTPVIDGVRRVGRVADSGAAQFSLSNTGSLVYIPGPTGSVAGSDLAFFDRKGSPEPLKLPPGPYEHPRVSPDGARIVFGSDDGEEANVWIYELSGATAMRRLTFGGRNKFPIWSGDGVRVAFQSNSEGDHGILWQPADGTGTPERLTKPEQGVSHVPESLSPNGEWLLFSESKASKVALMLLSLKGRRVVPFGIEATTFTSAAFSPDGRWVAYSGRGITRENSDVFVQPFPPTGAKYQVTTGGDGHHAAWTPDGKELSYIPGAGRFASINVTTAPRFSFSGPTPIPPPGIQGAPRFQRNYDIARDGKRFVGVLAPGAPGGDASVGQVQVVLNWTEELKRLVPTN